MQQCLFFSNSEKVVAYCHYHNCGMTAKQMRCKDCLNKQCRHFEKNVDHPYWVQREILKQKKKDKKNEINKRADFARGVSYE